MRVLIVEDNENMRIVLRRYFEMVGCEVVEAEGVDEALEMIARTDAPKLITLDLNLGEGPVKTVDRIRDFKNRSPDSLVVVITGTVTKEAEMRVLEAGADGFIHKLEVPTSSTFYEKLAQIGRSLISAPERYQRNIAIVEGMAAKFTHWAKEQAKA